MKIKPLNAQLRTFHYILLQIPKLQSNYQEQITPNQKQESVE